MSRALDTAMILAAGLGKRMRPLTDDKPKPLVMAAGKTLLDHALDMAAGGGCTRAIVNVHYFPEQVEAHVAARNSGLDIQVSDERGLLLETGGGVLNALPLIARDTLVVFNADNIWVDGPEQTVRALIAAWQPEIMDALLLLTPAATATGYDGPGDFSMMGDGRLARRGDGATAPYVYAGIHLLKTSLFSGMAIEPFSLNRVWNIASERGRLFGSKFTGDWYHVGTPQGVALADTKLRVHG